MSQAMSETDIASNVRDINDNNNEEKKEEKEEEEILHISTTSPRLEFTDKDTKGWGSLCAIDYSTCLGTIPPELMKNELPPSNYDKMLQHVSRKVFEQFKVGQLTLLTLLRIIYNALTCDLSDESKQWVDSLPIKDLQLNYTQRLTIAQTFRDSIFALRGGGRATYITHNPPLKKNKKNWSGSEYIEKKKYSEQRSFGLSQLMCDPSDERQLTICEGVATIFQSRFEQLLQHPQQSLARWTFPEESKLNGIQTSCPVCPLDQEEEEEEEPSQLRFLRLRNKVRSCVGGDCATPTTPLNAVEGILICCRFPAVLFNFTSYFLFFYYQKKKKKRNMYICVCDYSAKWLPYFLCEENYTCAWPIDSAGQQQQEQQEQQQGQQQEQQQQEQQQEQQQRQQQGQNQSQLRNSDKTDAKKKKKIQHKNKDKEKDGNKDKNKDKDKRGNKGKQMQLLKKADTASQAIKQVRRWHDDNDDDKPNAHVLQRDNKKKANAMSKRKNELLGLVLKDICSTPYGSASLSKSKRDGSLVGTRK
ncbi:hypothetical protein RFI_39783, partial [Reticulomyxa filosa]